LLFRAIIFFDLIQTPLTLNCLLLVYFIPISFAVWMNYLAIPFCSELGYYRPY
jgi:hypothetical protein